MLRSPVEAAAPHFGAISLHATRQGSDEASGGLKLSAPISSELKTEGQWQTVRPEAETRSEGIQRNLIYRGSDQESRPFFNFLWCLVSFL